MLLIRPKPYPLESARGFVLRVSERNGLDSPRWLLSYPAKGHEDLASMLNKNKKRLDSLRGPIANLAQLNAPDPGGLPMRYWNTRRPRFCPCCLAEASYWRASWDLVFSVACAKHGMRLHDECPQCFKSLSWDRPHIMTCSCGFDLREATVGKAPEIAVKLTREIETRFQPNVLPQEEAIAVLHALDLEMLMRLVWFLGAYSRNAHRKPQKIVGLETSEIAGEMVEQAMAVLADQPAGFNRLLDEIAARDKPARSSNKLGARFGWFYAALYKSFPGTEFEFLRIGFEAYLRNNWNGQLARRNRRLSANLRTEHEWVSIAEAAKLLKVRSEKVRNFLDEGILEGQLHETKSGRHMGVIHRDNLNMLIGRKRDWITLKDARTLLGISRKRAYALLDKGILKPISGPAVDGQTVWSFQMQDILAIAGQPGMRAARVI